METIKPFLETKKNDVMVYFCSAPPYPTNGMAMTAFGNQASNAANALASHPILQQG